jgi:hypothetical protein
MTPVLSPVTTLVVGPGNCRFADFLRIGVPFTIIALPASILLVPIILPCRTNRIDLRQPRGGPPQCALRLPEDQ